MADASDTPTPDELDAENRKLKKLIDDAQRIHREIDDHLAKLRRVKPDDSGGALTNKK